MMIIISQLNFQRFIILDLNPHIRYKTFVIDSKYDLLYFYLFGFEIKFTDKLTFKTSFGHTVRVSGSRRDEEYKVDSLN